MDVAGSTTKIAAVGFIPDIPTDEVQVLPVTRTSEGNSTAATILALKAIPEVVITEASDAAPTDQPTTDAEKAATETGTSEVEKTESTVAASTEEVPAPAPSEPKKDVAQKVDVDVAVEPQQSTEATTFPAPTEPANDVVVTESQAPATDQAATEATTQEPVKPHDTTKVTPTPAPTTTFTSASTKVGPSSQPQKPIPIVEIARPPIRKYDSDEEIDARLNVWK
ncbi:uncharacterized protein LOC131023034 [Salvia miltiorrhiza]|uniref:uncharacterized protein LOC131023034 n=1 Tax=Salvia miltiorrhiza TaxID=226208 RepID=UPI0025AC6228|nr:uncharacterized protein LOC131023034 [Salvia miltiorrhiza]